MKTAQRTVAVILGFSLISTIILVLLLGNLTSSAQSNFEATGQLMNAVQYGGNAEAIKLLLEKGADPNAKDNQGWHALQLAAKRGDVNIVRLLLEKGADANTTNNWGVTALGSAAFRGYLDIVRLLLEKGADLNIKFDGHSTAISDAAMGGFTNVVGFLLDKGADINETNWSGDSVLMTAVDEGKTEVVRLLLTKGVKVNMEDMMGNSALDKATKNGNAVIIQMLQRAGAAKSSAVKQDEELKDALKKLQESSVALSNSLQNFQQPEAIPSVAPTKAIINPAVASGTNTDSSGYVTNVNLLTPFTVTNSAGKVFTDAVLVKLMANNTTVRLNFC